MVKCESQSILRIYDYISESVISWNCLGSAALLSAMYRAAVAFDSIRLTRRTEFRTEPAGSLVPAKAIKLPSLAHRRALLACSRLSTMLRFFHSTAPAAVFTSVRPPQLHSYSTRRTQFLPLPTTKAATPCTGPAASSRSLSAPSTPLQKMQAFRWLERGWNFLKFHI